MNRAKISVAAILGICCGSALAAGITPGDLVVYRVGDGTGSLVNTGSAVFVDEYTPIGTLVQSIALPSGSTLPAGQNDLIASGTATSEGLLTVSPNGQYIALTGYGAALGSQTKNISGTASTAVPRTVGIINTSTGAVDTSTALTDFVTGNNPRTAFTTDGTNIWVGGAGDVSATTLGSTTSTQITTAVTNVEQLNDFGGQVYFSSQKTTGAIGSIGNGLPMASGQSTTMLTGGPTDKNAYGFVFFDLSSTVPGLDTLYVADDTTSGGEIFKFDLISGTWTPEGSIAAAAVRGLTGTIDSSGNVDLFAATGGGAAAGGGALYSFVDNTGFGGMVSGTATTIAAAATDEAFRGVAFVPLAPEPAAMMSLVLPAVLMRRRRD